MFVIFRKMRKKRKHYVQNECLQFGYFISSVQEYVIVVLCGGVKLFSLDNLVCVIVL